jgi:hypothetical protein
VSVHNHWSAEKGRQAGSFLAPAALLMACLWLGGGCRSVVGPGHESLASVVVSGPTALETARAVSEVFRQAGYKPLPLPDNKDMRLEFDKPAGAMANVLYGGWNPDNVWLRVKVRIAGLDEGGQLVTCDLYRVTDYGDTHFEAERKISPANKDLYRDLLNQVKARATRNPN